MWKGRGLRRPRCALLRHTGAGFGSEEDSTNSPGERRISFTAVHTVSLKGKSRVWLEVQPVGRCGRTRSATGVRLDCEYSSALTSLALGEGPT